MSAVEAKKRTNPFWTIWGTAFRGFYGGGSKGTIKEHPCTGLCRVISHQETLRGAHAHGRSWAFRQHGGGGKEEGSRGECEGGKLLSACVPLSCLQMSSSTSSMWHSCVRSLLNKDFFPLLKLKIAVVFAALQKINIISILSVMQSWDLGVVASKYMVELVFYRL